MVSIPRSEFWSFGHIIIRCRLDFTTMFQFLGRNSGRSDDSDVHAWLRPAAVSIPRSEFWSFGHEARSHFQAVGDQCFNSSIGILVVRTSRRLRPADGDVQVSIPRSEFWSFGLKNSRRITKTTRLFQFLGRNSGRSDVFGVCRKARH